MEVTSVWKLKGLLFTYVLYSWKSYSTIPNTKYEGRLCEKAKHSTDRYNLRNTRDVFREGDFVLEEISR